MPHRYLPDPIEVGKDVLTLLREKVEGAYQLIGFFRQAGYIGGEVVELLQYPDRKYLNQHIITDYGYLQRFYTKVKANHAEPPLEQVIDEVMNFTEKIKKELDSNASTKTLEDARYLKRWGERVAKSRGCELEAGFGSI